MYTTLVVFDFDGTLFRSPHPPSWWGGRDWWLNSESLNSPMVPTEPEPDWWNNEVVDRARTACENDNNLVILLSARPEGPFRRRIETLVSQAGLQFAGVYLHKGEMSAEDFKMGVMGKLLEDNPSIRGVSIWEDRENHLQKFADWVESNGRACFPHLVTATPQVITASSSRVAARYQEKKKVPAKDGGETTVYVYSDRQIANRNREKAERVEGLRTQMGDLRKCVKKDLKSKDDHTRLVALAVALMDETCERVGNHESAAEGHFGVTGWQTDHVTVKGDKVTIKYVGKSGVKHEKVVENPAAVSLLKELTKGKKDSDQLLSFDDKGLDPEDVNAYLKKFDVTAKDIRGFRANDEMCKALKAERSKGPDLPKDRKEKDKILKAEFKKALEVVAEIVGHEASTLRSQYLVPSLEDTYVHDGSVLKDLTGKKASVDYTQLQEWVAGFYDRHPDLRSYANVRVFSKDATSGRHPEASTASKGIELYPKFWELPSERARDVVFSHELGHWVLGLYGLSAFVKLAESFGVDVWDREQLPFSAINFDEAFAESWAEFHLSLRDLRHRHPLWAQMVKAVKGSGKVATKTDSEREDEAAEELIRPSPKKKPPRNDLRNRKVDDDDPDRERLNYKTTRSASNVALAYRVADTFLARNAAFVKSAIEFDTKEELKSYLEAHPDAEAKDHSVKPKKQKQPPPHKDEEREVGSDTVVDEPKEVGSDTVVEEPKEVGSDTVVDEPKEVGSDTVVDEPKEVGSDTIVDRPSVEPLPKDPKGGKAPKKPDAPKVDPKEQEKKNKEREELKKKERTEKLRGNRERNQKRLEMTLGKETAESLQKLTESAFGKDDIELLSRVDASTEKALQELKAEHSVDLSSGDYGSVVGALTMEGGDGEDVPFDEKASSRQIQEAANRRNDIKRKIKEIESGVTQSGDRVKSLEKGYVGGRGVEKAAPALERAKARPKSTKLKKQLGLLQKPPTKSTKPLSPEETAARKTEISELESEIKQTEKAEDEEIAKAEENLNRAKSDDASYEEEHGKSLSEADAAEQESAGLAEKSLPELKKQLEEETEKLGTLVTNHHAIVSMRATLANPDADMPGEIDTRDFDSYRENSLERYQGLPSDLRSQRLKSSLTALKQVEGELKRPDLSPDSRRILEAKRGYYKADVDAGRLTKTIKGEGENGKADKSKPDFAKSLVQFAGKANPDSPHLFGLAEGVKGEKFRKSVHNVLGPLEDKDWIEAVEAHVPERSKGMLDVLRKGTYENVEGGGEQEPLTPEMSAYLRKSILNALMNDAGAAGEEADEGLGGTSAPVKSKRLDGAKSSPSKGDGKSWFSRFLALFRRKGKKPKDTPYQSKLASSEVSVGVVVDRWYGRQK